MRRGLSLTARLVLTAQGMVAIALIAAGIAFYAVADSVITESVTSHIQSRAEEVLEAAVRYQRERALAVQTWAEAEAMQSSLDSQDPKFAEDYLRRTLQDHPDAFDWAALVGSDGRVVAAVRPAKGSRRGEVVESARGQLLECASLGEANRTRTVAASLGVSPFPSQPGAQKSELTVSAPIIDFAGDQVGAVTAAVSPVGMERLLAEVVGAESPYLPLLFDSDRRLVLGLPGGPSRALSAPLFSVPKGAGATSKALLFLPASGEVGAHLAMVQSRSKDERPRWSAAVLVAREHAFGPLARLRNVLLLAFVVVLGLVGLLTRLGVRRVARPLSEVAASMSKVAQGDLSIRLTDQPAEELGRLVRSFNTMVVEVARSREELKKAEALKKELEIAHTIQTSVLPREPRLPGFEVAARMKPASEVGGDFYDIIPAGKGFWLLIGDVSGHGLNSGLIGLMVQAAAQAAITGRPDRSPTEVVSEVNRVIYENVRRRMRGDDYVTLIALRHRGEGRFVAAGAHQPLYLVRSEGKVDVLPTQGPWCGLSPDISSQLLEREFELQRGESLWLVTDGIVESEGPGGELFGEERLMGCIRQHHNRSSEESLQALMMEVENFTATQHDDVTAMTLKRCEDG
ncbi:MAG: SpoIIE family protein phosphatase [Myxococcales bacterium]|nr:SpoIIE family protein phosphatase [Myxococcales bacterium]